MRRRADNHSVMINRNISAISTASGVGGVAIIRVSGDGALSVAAKIFRPLKNVRVEDFVPNVMYAGNILCDGFTDFGMCVYFRAPKSFTGEDVVEFHCHGGTEIARGVLKATFSNGAVPAERGEFTKRAFLNGKLSLSSAEGMIDMINAESLAELRAGNMLYAEKLSNEVRGIQSRLTDILAGIAADVDYPEEDVEASELADVKDDLVKIGKQLETLLRSYEGGKKIKSGITVALCGKPNVGKSSLLNALLGYDKAIVSPVAGTTRDAVEGTVEIGGVKYRLYDTAGLRERADAIEAEGIGRAKKILASADLVLAVTDDGEYAGIEGVSDGAEVIKIYNKCDVAAPRTSGYDLKVSAVTGEGIDGLKKRMADAVCGGVSLDGAYVVEERHYAALLRAKQSASAAADAVGNQPLDLVSIAIRECWNALGEITGETANEEIIDTVFAKFCVGK